MSSVVIEHVKVAELPEAWRAKLASSDEARVTVRIEEDRPAGPTGQDSRSAFGMWADRDEMGDMQGYVRALRAPRFSRGQDSEIAAARARSTWDRLNRSGRKARSAEHCPALRIQVDCPVVIR